MLFQLKKKAQANLPILYKENIKVDCEVSSKEEAIRLVGQMLVDSNYVEADYVEGMLNRELVFSTYMGNGLALPHGTEDAKKAVKATGIAVVVLKNPVSWGDEDAKLIIGIAGVGDAHVDMLSKVAGIMLEEETEQLLFSGDPDSIYKILTEEN